MGIIARFAEIIKANVNDLIDKCEDPEKMIDQSIRKATEDLAEVKKETAEIMAIESDAKRKVDKLSVEVSEYTEAAKKALLAGNEGDATKLLERKQELTTQLEKATGNYNLAKANADKMRQMYDKLTHDIQTLTERRDNIKAQVKMAKAQEKLNDVASSVNAQDAIDTFNRMEAKAQKMYDTAAAEAQLNVEAASDGAADLKEKYGAGSASVSDELEKMKRELGLIKDDVPAGDAVDAYLQGTE